MPKATRFTTKYVSAEDRIQLLIELSQDEIQVLWLTRRLFNRLLPHLFDHLGKTGTAVVATDTNPSDVGGGIDPQQANAVQRFSQEAAVSALTSQPSVGASGQKPANNVSYVVTSVDVRFSKKGVVLDLKSGEDILHKLPLAEDALRQWLSIVYSQYKAGNWQERFWPVWIGPASSSKQQADEPLLN
ncbi:hypothetical protein JQT66_19265 [Sulfitobacter mediterraneus]|uniref:hypothetical protein n=1 Tax=Sulfitobacter mediterraneus TaxID=83219 RepID=UPI0019331F3C|nr:hypothetical protein [Sulfitobacter mediterraneus]MBM1312321.1 hypothetical protein [Sulfitobacter mediterraneus]MBM1316199.1 hypothetical protein [Sulfitobacter mediterraneus]MBM1324565.1 hypothetical protein [Sulfitobacter mediterraneus]MBM1328475.1 hypothetical protein [Sulfitobacter mediterraneus]MBM1399825.1 hypothetical protein [Sulfitobacter mediterraneus]